jgi:hypothetical protein
MARFAGLVRKKGLAATLTRDELARAFAAALTQHCARWRAIWPVLRATAASKG